MVKLYRLACALAAGMLVGWYLLLLSPSPLIFRESSIPETPSFIAATAIDPLTISDSTNLTTSQTWLFSNYVYHDIAISADYPPGRKVCVPEGCVTIEDIRRLAFERTVTNTTPR